MGIYDSAVHFNIRSWWKIPFFLLTCCRAYFFCMILILAGFQGCKDRSRTCHGHSFFLCSISALKSAVIVDYCLKGYLLNRKHLHKTLQRLEKFHWKRHPLRTIINRRCYQGASIKDACSKLRFSDFQKQKCTSHIVLLMIFLRQGGQF